MIPFSIAFSLLFLGGITFWLLVESKISVIFKTGMTTLFCLFTVGVFLSLKTFLGWAALEQDLPEDVTIIAVNIKEPNFRLGNKGRIYLTLDSVKSKYDNKFLNMFGYVSEKNEPRLFSVPYSRNLHEKLEKEVIPRLKDGQSVRGKLKKGKPGEGKGKKSGKGDGEKDGDKNGGGSESLEQEYQFYNLTPGEIQAK